MLSLHTLSLQSSTIGRSLSLYTEGSGPETSFFLVIAVLKLDLKLSWSWQERSEFSQPDISMAVSLSYMCFFATHLLQGSFESVKVRMI